MLPYSKYIADFLASLENSNDPENDLRKENIVSYFIKFLEEKGVAYAKHSLEKKYQDCRHYLDEGESFEDFVYKDCIGLYSDVLEEYHIISAQADKYNTLVSSRINCFQKSADQAASGSEREMYQGYISDIQTLRKGVGGRTKKSELIKAALKNSQRGFLPIIWLTEGFMTDILAVSCVGENHRMLISFGKLPVKEADAMMELKRTNHEEYMQKFRIIMTEYNFSAELREKIKATPAVNNRYNLIDTALKLLEMKNYEAFVYLLVPQIEGLLNEYRKIKGDSSETNGLYQVVDSMRKTEQFPQYDYFKFIFRDKRNIVAHGKMIAVTEGDAYDLLMDALFIVNMICTAMAETSH